MDFLKKLSALLLSYKMTHSRKRCIAVSMAGIIFIVSVCGQAEPVFTYSSNTVENMADAELAVEGTEGSAGRQIRSVLPKEISDILKEKEKIKKRAEKTNHLKIPSLYQKQKRHKSRNILKQWN